ncbi:ATP-dependent RNA helicase chl1 [Radiomyces spectabilis]|uniref:ATP-dependent RNA helicase chl1 n=1 Tax=Radiomyces spectabilis TaxID=64574 RepID=UPI00221F637C|nr:ATP-dependent RNA helicase chl1 [Radiomyces spectabilis]KAI8379057.1 ATP-dependent RNA helicase chl1 [Radiomyces spectabilis]
MSVEDFGFPYVPYSIQNEFMVALYDTLSKGKIGIFESPTGTGKSLSLICGSLAWLTKLDNETKESTAETANAADDEPDWLKSFPANDDLLNSRQARDRQREDLRQRIQRVRMAQQTGNHLLCTHQKSMRFKRPKKDSPAAKNAKDEAFLLDNYDSDEEEPPYPVNQSSRRNEGHLSKEVQSLLARLESKSTTANDNREDLPAEEDVLAETKIFYASRTHSQLAQFAHEIKKTKYADEIRVLSLGSRQGLCINEKVQKLKNLNRMNEACLEMQGQSDPDKKCQYLPSSLQQSKWNEFRDHALADVHDIEDLGNIGKHLSTCPYYGTRQTLPPSQLVVLPYQHLLHANTRESLGIELKGNVVIIDEAHNLIDTINSIHTVTLSLSQMRMAFSQLRMYLQRYKTRLLGKNVVYIQQIMNIIKMMAQALQPAEKRDQILRVNDFVHQIGIDHINMFKIQKYLKESKLARKLNGFVDYVREEENQRLQNETSHGQTQGTGSASKVSHTSTGVPILTQVESFVMALVNPDADGRIVLNVTGQEASEPFIKYMLLNPAEAFKPIVDQARSIILAGGTMQPISDFTRTLLYEIPAERLNQFSCGHIIPSTNLLTLAVDEGPRGGPLLFNFTNRQNMQMIDETGQMIINFCNIIPDGVVCFFPSFSYLELVFKRWSSADSGHILQRIEKKKKVFKEPKESNMVEATLRDYSLQIESKSSSGSQTGALLLCVVNGKMSEGINFSDQLGRGIIMVGLPFGNKDSLELREKIKFASEHLREGEVNGAAAGQDYYENLCMRGVNQSIGRAIRHKNDYAVIVLLDKRYSTGRIRNKLPGWIGTHVDHCTKFGHAIAKSARFFKDKKIG